MNTSEDLTAPLKINKNSSAEQKEIRAANKQELEAVCAWIKTNINEHIGWDELSRHTKRSHKDLIELFRQINTTPMAYIRYAKESLKLKEDIKVKTSSIVKNIQRTGAAEIPIKRSKLITQSRITKLDSPSRTEQPNRPKSLGSNAATHLDAHAHANTSARTKPTKQNESTNNLNDAQQIYQSRKQEITRKIQSMDAEIKVIIDSNMDMHESNSHIITLRKGQDVRTIGLNKDEFFNADDQFNINALLRIMTAMNEMR